MTRIELKTRAVRIFNMCESQSAQLAVLQNELPNNTREFIIVEQLIYFLQTPKSSDELDSYLTSLLDTPA